MQEGGTLRQLIHELSPWQRLKPPANTNSRRCHTIEGVVVGTDTVRDGKGVPVYGGGDSAVYKSL